RTPKMTSVCSPYFEFCWRPPAVTGVLPHEHILTKILADISELSEDGPYESDDDECPPFKAGTVDYSRQVRMTMYEFYVFLALVESNAPENRTVRAMYSGTILVQWVTCTKGGLTASGEYTGKDARHNMFQPLDPMRLCDRQ